MKILFIGLLLISGITVANSGIVGIGYDPTTISGAKLAVNGNVGIGTTTPQQTFTLQGTGTTDLFNLASSSGVSSLIVKSNGNVGIGTTTPGTKLTVVSASPSNPYAGLSMLSGTATDYTAIAVGRTTPEVWLGVVGVANNYASGSQPGDSAIVHTGNLIYASTIGGSPQVTFATSSNVIFGVNTTALTATPLNVSFGGTYGSGAPGSQANLKWDMYNAAGTNRYGIGMSAGLMEFQAGSNNDGNFAWYTGSGTERMRLTTAGNLGIGTTTPLYGLSVTPSAANATAFFKDSSSASSTNVTIQGGAGQGSNDVFDFGTQASPGSVRLRGDGLFFAPQTTISSSLSIVGNSPVLLFGTLLDSGISRISAGVLAVGNGSSGNISGTLIATNFSANTTSTSTVLTVQGLAGKDVTDISSSTGASLFHITQSGNVGIGTTTPGMQFVLGSGQMQLPLGAASTPSISPFGGANSGLYWTTATNLSISVSGTERYRFGSGGLLSNTDGISMGATIAVQDVWLRRTSANNLTLSSDGSSGAANLLVNGNIGIGTSTPIALLSLNASTTAAGGINFGDATANLYRSAAGTITTDGNLSGQSITANTGFKGNIGKANNSTLSLNFATAFSTANTTSVSAAQGTFSQTSGTNTGLLIGPIYNQASGSAANTDLLIQRTETALGSGAQYLIQAGTSTAASLFTVSNLGQGYFAGNVGIGTATPASALEFGASGAGITFSGGGTNTIKTNGNALFLQNGQAGQTIQAQAVLVEADNGAFGFSTERFRKLSAGNMYLEGANLGIGTTTPAARLSLTGSSSVDPFDISSTSGLSILHVTQAGNVGIGTANPTQTLNVIGSATFSGSIGTGGSLGGAGKNLFAGGVEIGASSRFAFANVNTPGGSDSDAVITRVGASSLRIGFESSAVPGVNTLTVGESSRGGTDSNVAGANGIIQSGLGTGTGGSGSLLFQTANPGASGTATNTYSTALAIVNTGKIGIGTTTPTALLSLNASTTAAGGINFGDATANLYRSAAGSLKTDGQLTVTGNIISGGMSPGGVSRTFITSPTNGNLLIENNTATDFNLLQFGGTTSSYAALQSASSTAPSGIALKVVGADGTTNANLYVTGNVGIGTTTPGSALEVNGNILFDNTFGINGRNSVGNIFNMLSLSASNVLTIGQQSSSLAATIINSGNNSTITLAPGGTVAAMTLVNGSGNVGIGTTTPGATLHVQASGSTIPFKVASSTGAGLMTLDTDGNLTIAGSLTQNGSPDVAENVIVSDSSIGAGDLVSIDMAYTASSTSDIYNRFAVTKATSTAQVLGVISTTPGIVINSAPSVATTTVVRPLALAGRVPVKVTNENGNIGVGDYLTASKQFPGYAMKATISGQVVGQALESFNSSSTADSGLVLVFVKVGYQNVNNTFEVGQNDGQVVGQVGNIASSSPSSFVINQKGSGNLLQLQQNGSDRVLIDNNGSVNILSSATTTGINVLAVKTASSTLFAINSVGQVSFTGHIMVGPDTAGTATINPGDNASTVTFGLPYGSVPKVIVTPGDVPVTFAIKNKTVNGFTIVINTPASQTINFDWFVVEQSNTTTSTSGTDLQVLAAPTPSVSSGSSGTSATDLSGGQAPANNVPVGTHVSPDVTNPSSDPAPAAAQAPDTTTPAPAAAADTSAPAADTVTSGPQANAADTAPSTP